MKILFLDIDGVLNRDGTQTKIGTGKMAAFVGLDPALVRRLLLWHARWPVVQIVLSSTWRLDPVCVDTIKAAGIPLLDMTKNMRTRQEEVRTWLEKNPGVKAYAILDDMQYFRGEMAQHFVQTSYKGGLEDKHLRKVEGILGLEEACTHMTIVDEIENRLQAYAMTGNGVSDMADLLEKARAYILEHEKPMRKRMLEFQQQMGGRFKVFSHPDCEKCAKARAQKRKHEAAKRAKGRDEVRYAQSRANSLANLKLASSHQKKKAQAIAEA